ncbi:MAG: sulfurtransferase [Dehalococcoidia bacterium]|nr:sulfurtransferase [Dehalococcoidia bacterium]
MAEYPGILVQPDWLAAHLNDPGLRLVDAGAPPRYQKVHIQGATTLNPGQLNDPTNPVPGQLLPPARFAQLMGGLGLGEEHHIVIYDDTITPGAARVFWALEYYGHGAVSVLDGGLGAWNSQGRPTASQPQRYPPATFTPRPRPERLATKASILEGLKRSDFLCLDTRTREEHTGQRQMALRGGHIPKSINSEWVNNLQQQGQVGFLKPLEQLRALYQQAGLTPDKEIASYCQAGVRAAHGYLALRILGYQRVSNYAGSWNEWGNDPTTPIEQ